MACRMSELFQKHLPVMLNEAVNGLIYDTHGIYVDATFGRGSHSRAILDIITSNSRLIAIDKDPEAVTYAHSYFLKEKRFKIFHSSFVNLKAILEKEHVFGKINGILFDLGVSSPQLDNPERGFSFNQPGDLDMRMDTTAGMTASEWLSTIGELELANIIWQYGEEKYSRRIAKAIINARRLSPITNTKELASIIVKAVPKRKEEKHPATRTFQAIRIAINNELTELKSALSQALDALTIGGRLVVISFHSLEDRIVKQFIHEHEKGLPLPPGLPIKSDHFNARLKSIKKAVKPSPLEINTNPRARSAILRIAEKIA